MKRARVTEENAYGTALDRLTGSDKPQQKPPAIEDVEQPASAMIKLSVFLNRQEDAYLENLASIAKFSGGKKISKSLGNVISPDYLVDKYGAESIRYFICRNFVFGEDGDFSEKVEHRLKLLTKYIDRI